MVRENVAMEGYFVPRSSETIAGRGRSVAILPYQESTETVTVTVRNHRIFKPDFKYRVEARTRIPYTYTTEIDPKDDHQLNLNLVFTYPRPPSGKPLKILLAWTALVVDYHWHAPTMETPTTLESGKILLQPKFLHTKKDSSKVLIITKTILTRSYKFNFSFKSPHRDKFSFTTTPVTNRMVILHVNRTDDNNNSWGQNLKVRWELVDPNKTVIESDEVQVGSHHRQHSVAVLPITLQNTVLQSSTPHFKLLTPFDRIGTYELYPQSTTQLYLIMKYIPTDIPAETEITWTYYHQVATKPITHRKLNLRGPHPIIRINPADLQQLSKRSHKTVLANDMPRKASSPVLDGDSSSVPDGEPSSQPTQNSTKGDNRTVGDNRLFLNCTWASADTTDNIADWIHSYTQINPYTFRLNMNQSKYDSTATLPDQIIASIYPQTISKTAVIHGLTKGYQQLTEYNKLIERNYGIYTNINSLQQIQYPLLVFHEGNISYAHQSYIHRYQHNCSVSFIDISVHCFQPPEVSEEQMIEKWIIGYKHMCMFHACQVWNYLRKYTYAMRLDEDCIVKDPIPNIFQDFHNRGLYHLGCPMTEWHLETLDTLPQFAEKWCQKIRYKPKNDPLINNKSIFSNVYVTRVAFWLSRGPQQFFRDMAKSEKLYIYRWGDLPIHNVVLNMFTTHDRICLDYSPLRYYHGSWGTEHP